MDVARLLDLHDQLGRGLAEAEPVATLAAMLLGALDGPGTVLGAATGAVLASTGGTLLRRGSAHTPGPLLPDVADPRVAPLEADGRRTGWLVHDATPDPLLDRACAATARALRTAEQRDALARLAGTDALTKLANRRTLTAVLEREVARCARSGETLAVVVLDLDHFKDLNDQLGHGAGDEALRNVAAALSCACRDFDTAARWGGEEFVVVLPGCGLAEAGHAAERLRTAIAAAPGRRPVTASAGVAVYPLHGRDAEGLLEAADAALYDSKRAGRDRSRLAQPTGDARTALQARFARR